LHCSKASIEIFHVNCLPDNGTAEMYTADEHKMAVATSKMECLCSGFGGQNQLFQYERHYHWEYWRTSIWNTVHQVLEQFEETGGALHKTGTSAV
jgi:hypothetical protein